MTEAAVLTGIQSCRSGVRADEHPAFRALDFLWS